MSRLEISRNLATTTPDDLPSVIDSYLNAIIDQWNGSPQVYQTSTAQALPQGIQAGDLLVGFNSNNNPQFSFFTGNSIANLSQDTVTGYMKFLPPSSAAGAPTTTQFPDDGHWGFYIDNSGPTTYLARNNAGTIQTTTLT